MISDKIQAPFHTLLFSDMYQQNCYKFLPPLCFMDWLQFLISTAYLNFLMPFHHYGNLYKIWRHFAIVLFYFWLCFIFCPFLWFLRSFSLSFGMHLRSFFADHVMFMSKNFSSDMQIEINSDLLWDLGISHAHHNLCQVLIPWHCWRFRFVKRKRLIPISCCEWTNR